MSESVAVAEAHSAEAVAPDEPFDKADISTFQSDDAEAGTNICKLLVAFFFYSLLAMAFVAWWAYGAMQVNRSEAPVVESHSAGH